MYSDVQHIFHLFNKPSFLSQLQIIALEINCFEIYEPHIAILLLTIICI